jgi:Domain of unknown function (DUF397)
VHRLRHLLGSGVRARAGTGAAGVLRHPWLGINLAATVEQVTSKAGGVNWQKASASVSGQCVEIATCGHEVLIRDSKRPEGGHLTVTPEAWNAFLATSKAARRVA